MLARVGIETVTELRRLGGLEAYWRLRRAAVTKSLNALWALVGALEPWPEGRDWHSVATSRERLGLLLAIESREQARQQVLAAVGAGAAKKPRRGTRASRFPRGRGARQKGSALTDPRSMLLPERAPKK
jgi:hypothetical protein